MKRRIRYLTLLMLLLVGSTGSWAQDEEPFNPASPDEPGPLGVPMLSLTAEPVEGGTVSGAGWYDVGAQVSLRAYNKANFVFDRWIDANGETISTAAQFKYTKKEGNETLTACFRFSPGNPAEPEEIVQQVYYQLTLVAEEGGSVSGGGKYQPGTRVQIAASTKTGYVFDGWFDAEGNMLSTTANYYYTTTAAAVKLTARFSFLPSSPSEPVIPDILLMHKVTVLAEEGGTVSGGGTLKENTTTTITAKANTNYVFKGWYVDNTLYSTAASFKYTVGTEDITFTAHFEFNPSSPSDPSQPDTHKYAFYLLNMVTKPGATIRFPIYLTSLDKLTDITFQLTFPVELQPDLNNIEISAKAVGYTVSVTDGDEANSHVISLTGGTVPDGNTPILVFTVPIPQDIATAQNYQVRINQVTVKEADGTVTTASTRNGRISVYKNGDANGDDVVSIIDAVSVVDCILGNRPDDFIEEAANTNDDEGISIIDAVGVVDIILGDGNESRSQKEMPVADPD